ncbi:MAG: hypothetical protein P9M06_03675, partial [Candidatus Saelkia tenebricola]|nr:hypothetical protein [Candidatus Saelkia tenebricola]
DKEVKAIVVQSLGKAAGATLLEIAQSGDTPALSEAFQTTERILDGLSGDDQKVFTQALNNTASDSNNSLLVEYMVKEGYRDMEFDTTNMPQYDSDKGGFVPQGTLGVSGTSSESEWSVSGSGLSVANPSEYSGLGNESNYDFIQVTSIAQLTAGPQVPGAISPAIYAVVAGYISEYGLDSTVDGMVSGLRNSSSEIQALFVEAERAGIRFDGDALVYALESLGVEFMRDMELAGLNLSDYAAVLMFQNSITSFIQLLYKDLKDVGSLRETASDWDNLVGFNSPGAIIKEILERLNPKKTDQKANMKIAFPRRVSLKIFIILFLSMAIFSMVLGRSIARYYLDLATAKDPGYF